MIKITKNNYQDIWQTIKIALEELNTPNGNIAYYTEGKIKAHQAANLIMTRLEQNHEKTSKMYGINDIYK